MDICSIFQQVRKILDTPQSDSKPAKLASSLEKHMNFSERRREGCKILFSLTF